MAAVSTPYGFRGIIQASTYISERVDKQGADGMSEDAEAEHVDEKECRDEVPDKVSRCEGLDHAAGTGVPPYARLPVHSLALLIGVHAP